MVTLTVLGLAALIALGTGLYLTNRTQNTTVPNLVGRNITDATTLLQQKTARRSAPRRRCTTPRARSATSSRPIPAAGHAGAQEQPGRPVVLRRTRLGPGWRAGGDRAVRGPGREPAQERRSGRWSCSRSTAPPPRARSSASKPDEHSPVNVGDKVQLQVSKGNQAKLIDLVGMTQAAAESQLKDLGFTNVQGRAEHGRRSEQGRHRHRPGADRRARRTSRTRRSSSTSASHRPRRRPPRRRSPAPSPSS